MQRQETQSSIPMTYWLLPFFCYFLCKLGIKSRTFSSKSTVWWFNDVISGMNVSCSSCKTLLLYCSFYSSSLMLQHLPSILTSNNIFWPKPQTLLADMSEGMPLHLLIVRGSNYSLESGWSSGPTWTLLYISVNNLAVIFRILLCRIVTKPDFFCKIGHIANWNLTRMHLFLGFELVSIHSGFV